MVGSSELRSALATSQSIEGTRGGAHRLRGDAGVNLGSAHTAVAQQRLNDPDIRAGFQQMRGKGMTQTAHVNRLG